MGKTKLPQVHWQYYFDSFDYAIYLSLETRQTMAGVTRPGEKIVDSLVVITENNICKLFYPW